VEAEEKFPKNPVGIDSKEGFAKGNETGDMQDRIRRELVKLHAIDEKEPMMKLVGRKRNTAEEESKKHNLISARGLGDALGAEEDDRHLSGEKPLCPGLVQIGFLEL
jgi:hypothetical protein